MAFPARMSRAATRISGCGTVGLSVLLGYSRACRKALYGARDGGRQERQDARILCKVRIDWKTPPDYGLWIARHEPTADALRQMRVDTANLAVAPAHQHRRAGV